MSVKPIKTGPNKWRVVVSMGKSADGKRLRHIETVTGKHSDAIRRRNEIEVLRDKGIITPQVRLTLAEHLRNWLAGYVATKCSSRTIDSYTSIVERHIIPNLGHFMLRQLNHQAIQEYYSKAKESLTPRTVAKHHRLLSQALKYAVRQGFLARNPCDLVDAPSWQPKEMRTLTKEEAAIFLKAASSSIYYPVYYTAIHTGLRQAELCGLRWRDIHLDLAQPSLSVSQVLYKRRGVCQFKEPKTDRSRRQVKLTGNLAAYLKEYRAERESFYLHLGQLLTLDSLVFGNLNKPCDPSMLSHDFAKIAKRAGIKEACFHTLRHSFASLALDEGAAPKVISEMLGHASVAFTLQTYSHSISGQQEKAMELLNNVLPEGFVTKLSPED
jgi:integrase